MSGHTHNVSEISDIPIGISTKITSISFISGEWKDGTQPFTLQVPDIPIGSHIYGAIITAGNAVANDYVCGTGYICKDSLWYSSIGIGQYSYYGSSQHEYVTNLTYIDVKINQSSITFSDSADFINLMDTRYGILTITAIVFCIS